VPDPRAGLSDEPERAHALLSLAAATETLAGVSSHTRLLELVVQIAARVIDAATASMLLIDQGTQELAFVVAYDTSPHDDAVEFGAPGINIRVAWRNGGWLRATGNSFAAPHITGLVARQRAKHPGLTPFQVKVILRALAPNVGM
jgi:subtilisin family serine protease